MYKIKSLGIKDFRAFRDQKIEIPSSAQIILITGNNGLGKTSFFDAVEWGFTGSLRRYEEESREKNKEIFMKNKFADNNGQVEITLADPNDQNIKFTRKTKTTANTDFNSGDLNLNDKKNNNIAELLLKDKNRDDFDFKSSFSFSHLLSQEILADFVRSYKSSERYSILSNLAGLKNYNNFNNKIKEIRKETENKNEDLIDYKTSLEAERKVLLAEFNNSNLDGSSFKESLAELKEIISGFDLKNTLQAKDSLTNEGMKNLLSEMKKLKDKNDKLLHELSEKESSARKLSSQFIKYDFSKKDKQNYAKNLKDLKEEKKKLNDYQKLLFINSNFDLLNNELNYEEIKNDRQETLEHLNKIIKLINDVPPIKIVTKNLIELDKKAEKLFLEDLEEINKITGEIDDFKKELTTVKEKIDNFNDLRNKILTLSKEYFQANLSAKKCPVCSNKIEADELLLVLEDKLEINEEVKIKDWKLKKEDLKATISKKNEELTQLLKKLEKNYNEYTNQIYNKKRELETAIENYTEKNSKSKELKRKINGLGLNDKNDIHTVVKEKINQYEKEMKFDDLNKLESEIEKAEARLTESNQFISDYELRLENLDLNKDESINKYYKKVKTKIEKVKFENQITNKAIKKLKVLINYFSNTDLSKQIGNLKSKIKVEAKKIKTLEDKISELKKLEKEIPVVINDLTEETLNGYKNLANKIYQSINPQPIYNKIDWKRSSAYNKGQLVLNMKSENDSNSANPSYIYSSAQINVVVLSLFLSFVLKNNWSKLNSVFLDDPIQNMDDINIFSFIDVIRAILLNGNRPEQIFISTHDRDLYSFLLKKFRIFNVLSLEFKSYDIDGPEINRRYFEPEF